MSSIDTFNLLHNEETSKEELLELSGRLQSDGFYEEARRAAYIASLIKKGEVIRIELKAQGLNGPAHNGLAKEALDGCGRLKKGFVFIKGGKIKRVQKKEQKTKEKPKATPTKNDKPKKYDFIYEVSHTGGYIVKSFIKFEETRSVKKRKGNFNVKGLREYKVTEIGLKGLKKKYPNNSYGNKHELTSKDLKKAKGQGLKGAVTKREDPTVKPCPIPNDGMLRRMDQRMKKPPLFKIAGETGKFLQAIEKKPMGSVVVVLSTPQGTGKTTTAYKWINDLAKDNRCLFLSLEEHPDSALALEKEDAYINPKVKSNIITTGEVPNLDVLDQWIKGHDVIVLDSWQKLTKKLGRLDLDSDFRKKYNGKVFVFIIQQTTDGKVKGGSDIVFDGDVIVLGHKGDSFKENYLYFDKNRYTKVDLQQLHYNISTGKVYNPMEKKPEEKKPQKKYDSWLEVK